MTEPFSTCCLSSSLVKVLILMFGTTVAAVVVFAFTMPKTRREFILALICTLAFSLGGGSTLIMWFGIEGWSVSWFGRIAHGWIYFMCALPGWVTVRWYFTLVTTNPQQNPIELIKESLR